MCGAPLEEVKALAPDSLTVHSLAIKRAASSTCSGRVRGLKIQNTPEMITELSAAPLPAR